MVSMKWCLNVKNGIELVNPNNNMSNSYLKMAEESLRIIKNVDSSKIWAASTSYYTIYYCLYSLMMKFGVKCEIHACSIEFMKQFLMEFYNSEDVNLIETGFEIRNNLQYYPDRFFDSKKLEFIKTKSADFVVKTKEILSKITEKDIQQVRYDLKKRKVK